MQNEIGSSKEAVTEKKEISYYDRKLMGLKAKPEDDGTVKEILQLLAKKGITVDRARKVLKDVQTLLSCLAKLPYRGDSNCDS